MVGQNTSLFQTYVYMMLKQKHLSTFLKYDVFLSLVEGTYIWKQW